MDIEAIAAQVADEYQMGFGGVELDFALEVARRAVAAEREACAKVCESMIDQVDEEWRNKRPDEAAEFDASDAGKQACADAIRKRSNDQHNRPASAGPG